MMQRYGALAQPEEQQKMPSEVMARVILTGGTALSGKPRVIRHFTVGRKLF